MGRRIVDWKREYHNIEKLRHEGLTYEKIGIIYGVTRQAVEQGMQCARNRINKNMERGMNNGC